VRYALLAYGLSWAFVAGVLLAVRLLLEFHQWGSAGALWFDAAWLAALVPLYRAGVLSAAKLGLCPAPAGRSVGFALVVFIAAGVFDYEWHSVLAAGAISSPFAGVVVKKTVTIALTGAAAVVSPVVESVFFQGLMFRCFRNRFALLPASVVIGVMFALVHGEYPLVALPELAVYGGLGCLLYEYTGSLLPGIAINLYLDAGAFELALTGRVTIVFWGFVLLIAVLLARELMGRRGRRRLQPL
jgi:membrane protease YdiL (CAAX protease family)